MELKSTTRTGAWAQSSPSRTAGRSMPMRGTAKCYSSCSTATAASRTIAGAMAAPAHNDMDGYADDLAAVIEGLDLREATLVGHSTGGGEVARYIGRHGAKRVRKAVLIAAMPPIMLSAPSNPEGLPIEVFDKIRAGVAGDRSQYYKELALALYGANRPGAKVSQGTLDQFWLWSMQAGAKNAYESVKAFSETDFTEDLRKFDTPTLVLHGEDDQIVPVKDSAKKSAR